HPNYQIIKKTNEKYGPCYVPLYTRWVVSKNNIPLLNNINCKIFMRSKYMYNGRIPYYFVAEYVLNKELPKIKEYLLKYLKEINIEDGKISFSFKTSTKSWKHYVKLCEIDLSEKSKQKLEIYDYSKIYRTNNQKIKLIMKIEKKYKGMEKFIIEQIEELDTPIEEGIKINKSRLLYNLRYIGYGVYQLYHSLCDSKYETCRDGRISEEKFIHLDHFLEDKIKAKKTKSARK
ncbi:MAG: hypothetical protein KDH96_12765, partial [Candidatus Riesia sp.]|nr:hypothetical protein [Candidatus Riesia sp.]